MRSEVSQLRGIGRHQPGIGALLAALLVVLFVGGLVVRTIVHTSSAQRAVASSARPASSSNGLSPSGTPPSGAPLASAARAKAKVKAKASASPAPIGIPGKWKLILNSTFNGTSLDTDLWRASWFGTGYGISGPINSNEIACYDSSNVTFPGDGTVHLAVTAQHSRCEGHERSYTGAVLSTNPKDGRRSGGFTYRYGLLQAKVYVPGTGSEIANWPAVLTLGQVWPQDGENDIMENLQGTMCSHFHSPGFAPGGPLGACDPTFTAGWHVVSANWEPGSVTWYYDGVQIAHITRGVTSAPMYLILVNTVSTKAPGVARAAAMRVAYVRVWQTAA